MKKLLSLILVLSIVVTLLATVPVIADAADVWDGTTATAFAGGDGTESNPYQIANGAQLALMRDKVNDGTANTAYFKLTADITLNADIENPTNTWTPIGVGNAFKGVFDGNGKTIRGLYVQYAGADGTGFFAMVQDATIKKFALLNAYVESTATTNDCGETGGLAAFVKTVDKEALIDSVYIHATVIGFDANVGGCIGLLSGSSKKNITIQNCVFAGSATAKKAHVGGMVGNGNGAPTVIKDCLNAGNLTSLEERTVAGIMGRNDGIEKWEIRNCINVGVLKVQKDTLRHLVVGKSGDESNVVEDCYYIPAVSNVDGSNIAAFRGAPASETVQEKELDFFMGDTSITWENWTERKDDIIIPTGVAAFAPALYASNYTVTWKNEDGTVLATEEYEGGVMPEYKGTTPTKAEDDTYAYTFDGWSPVLAAITEDVTYTATYYKTRKGISIDDDDDETTAPETTPETKAPEAETNAPTTTEKRGCGAVVGSGAVLMALVACGAAAVVRKKKED